MDDRALTQMKTKRTSFSRWPRRMLKNDKSFYTLRRFDVRTTFKTLFSNVRSISDIIMLGQHPCRRMLAECNRKYAILYSLRDCLIELEKMTGLHEIKNRLFEIICYYGMGTRRQLQPTGMQHIVITGAPGTGKSHLGRIIAKIFARLQIIPSDRVLMAKRSDFIGEHLGSTAIKTQQLIDKALGGCLFIDEAYSLADKEHRDSFSKEALDCLNQNLTEKAGQFLCIIAGYETEIEQCFFGMNPGLKRRFPVHFKIERYSAADLTEMFLRQLEGAGWRVDPVAQAELVRLFTQKYDYFLYAGGDIQSLVQFSKIRYAVREIRTALQVPMSPTLCKNDIDEALEQLYASRKDSAGVSEMVKHMYL